MRPVEFSKIKMLLQLVLKPRHVRIVALLLTGFHILIVSNLIVHDLVFTAICGMLYTLATYLEEVPLPGPLWLLRWAVIVFVAWFIGSDLAIAPQVINEISEITGVAVTRLEARFFVTSILLTFELLAAAFHRQTEKPRLYSQRRTIPPGMKLMIPFEVTSRWGRIRIDVESKKATMKFGVRLLDARLNCLKALNQDGGYAADESRRRGGRFFLVINNKELTATLKVKITISLVKETHDDGGMLGPLLSRLLDPSERPANGITTPQPGSIIAPVGASAVLDGSEKGSI